MARGEGAENDKVVSLAPRLAAAAGGPYGPDLEARIAKLEASVEHIQSDLTDVRAALGRIEPKISEMVGAMPHLATKAELARRPTVAGIIAIIAMVAAIASIPIWPQWAAAIKAIAGASH